mmetsp:Transcript_124297/g.239777  ORF Transcript_124297/g.239777 Transcript_124297/m.239777 type:complete len:92 (-) Transcript_124297:47-322(-)
MHNLIEKQTHEHVDRRQHPKAPYCGVHACVDSLEEQKQRVACLQCLQNFEKTHQTYEPKHSEHSWVDGKGCTPESINAADSNDDCVEPYPA